MIYNIQASKSFLKSLIAGIFSKFGDDPLAMSKITILLPTKRSCKMFDETFLEMRDFQPSVIPRTYPIGDLGADEIIVGSFMLGDDISHMLTKEPISEFEQQIILSKLIRENHPKKSIGFSESMNLASSLIDFYYDFKRDEVDFSKLYELEMPEISAGWQEMLDFLKIITSEYPKYLKEIEKMDRVSYRNQILNSLSMIWQKIPPSNIVIIAGSTGSIQSTRKLIKTIANMKNGYVILPSLDQEISEEYWDKLDLSHPQYMIKKLLEFIDVKRENIDEWDGKIIDQPNSEFINAIFTPTELTHKWHFLSKNIKIKNLKLVECEKLSSEAAVIALMLRDFLEKQESTAPKKAIIVTNNSTLSKLIVAYAKRWDLFIENAEGEKLWASDKGKIFILIGKMILSDFSAIQTLSALKNIMLSLPDIKNIEDFEKAVFRGFRLKNGLKSIFRILEEYPILNEWFADFIKKGEEFINLYGKKTDFQITLTAHIKFIENICGPASEFYKNEDGEKLNSALVELLAVGEKIGKVTFAEYMHIFEEYMKLQSIKSVEEKSYGIKILSPIEARHIDADLIILAGVNEGNWPLKLKTNPWISKSMRDAIGLSPTQHITSLSAHDFYKLMHMQNVVITYSSHIDNAPVSPSGWIIRMKALAQYLSLDNQLKTNEPWEEWANLIDMPEEFVKISPPKPMPDIDIRPRKLSVTQIEKLIRNPYAIYASKILNLKPLDPLEKEPKASDFGSFVHDVLDRYNKDFAKIEIDHEQYLLKIGFEQLEKYKEFSVYFFWRERFINICNWFVKFDLEDRKDKIIHSEVHGKIEFDTKNGPFSIIARADRISIDNENNLTIIDYKTEQLPTLFDSRNFISPQLTLEGVIAIKNGFECLKKDLSYNLSTLTYILLRSREGGAEIKNILENEEIKIPEIIYNAEQNLYELIAKYDDKDTSYLAFPDKKIAPHYDDYIHLSRIKEWG